MRMTTRSKLPGSLIVLARSVGTDNCQGSNLDGATQQARQKPQLANLMVDPNTTENRKKT